MSKPNKRRDLKLRDAVAYAASCLKEAGDPRHNLGPSGQYADAFERYSQAMRTLVVHHCELPYFGVEEWDWDAYQGTFHFKWTFGAQTRELNAENEYELRHVGMHAYARLDDSKPLDEELARLRAEAEHFHAMRNAVMMWAAQQAKARAS